MASDEGAWGAEATERLARRTGAFGVPRSMRTDEAGVSGQAKVVAVGE